MSAQEYRDSEAVDFVVVGSGSSGGAIARELSQAGTHGRAAGAGAEAAAHQAISDAAAPGEVIRGAAGTRRAEAGPAPDSKSGAPRATELATYPPEIRSDPSGPFVLAGGRSCAATLSRAGAATAVSVCTGLGCGSSPATTASIRP